MRIIENKARCRICGEVVKSDPVEASMNKFCRCGAIAVSGGDRAIRRLGHHADIDEMSLKEY